MSTVLQKILKKYETYVSNIQWHIDTNKPTGGELIDCIGKRSQNEEIIRDLKAAISEEETQIREAWDRTGRKTGQDIAEMSIRLADALLQELSKTPNP